jgi:hypothetical protein
VTSDAHPPSDYFSLMANGYMVLVRSAVVCKLCVILIFYTVNASKALSLDDYGNDDGVECMRGFASLKKVHFASAVVYVRIFFF